VTPLHGTFSVFFQDFFYPISYISVQLTSFPNERELVPSFKSFKLYNIVRPELKINISQNSCKLGQFKI